MEPEIFYRFWKILKIGFTKTLPDYVELKISYALFY